MFSLSFPLGISELDPQAEGAVGRGSEERTLSGLWILSDWWVEQCPSSEEEESP